MKKLLGIFISGVLLALVSQLAFAQETTGDQPESAVSSSGYPYAGGKGPGMGRGYQQATPGPGRGSPNYRGGNGGTRETTGEVATADAVDANAVPEMVLESYPGWPRYPGRRGYGLGYPYGDQYPYPYRGRGAGYGPGRSGGYGYGYPGYRGRGGTGYPGHRQYASPPYYRADEAATD